MTAHEKVLVQEPGRRLRVDAWLADGRIVYTSSADDVAFEVKVLSPGAPTGTLVLQGGVTTEVDVSPDGKWMAYSAQQSDRSEVVVQAFAVDGPRAQVSAGGGYNAAWASDSRTVYYLEPPSGRVLHAVQAIEGGAIRPGPPREILRHPRAQGCVPYRCYGVAADGQRFLFSEPTAEPPTVSRMDLILNWSSTFEKTQ